ncbi:MAG TPA: SWIM zinc finger family protein, partial [Thermoanaerobaculia bacterium]
MPRKQTRPPHPSDDTLVRLIEPSNLRKLAGTRSFERGEEYAAIGAVTQIVEDRGTVAAKVQGTRTYLVSITADVGRLAFACNCPRGDDGDFCKHCVAVCLAWLDQRRAPIASSAVGTMGNVRDWLARQPTETLVGMIVEQAMESDELLRRLTLAAGRQSGKGLHLQQAMALLEAAAAAGDFVPYAEAHSYVNGILEALEVIPQFLDQGRASEALALAEHAIDLVGSDLPVDDSDGYLSAVFERTIDLHLAACRKAKPDPEALAAKLLQWELSDGMGMFDDAVDRYEGVLGKKGMAAYRRLAEERWNAASSKGAEKNHVLTSIMEGLATKAGDLEALVAVRMRDLSQPWSYAQIARDYLKAGKHEEALEWGEKGLAAFPQQWNDGGLRELVADEYHRLHRHDDAMKLIWASFVRTPGLSSYDPLRTHARRAGDWPAWRTKALDTMRRSISSTTKVRDPWHSPRGRSELVRI